MKKSIKRRLIGLLSTMGVLLVVFCAMNVGALKVIDGYNQEIALRPRDGMWNSRRTEPSLAVLMP